MGITRNTPPPPSPEVPAALDPSQARNAPPVYGQGGGAVLGRLSPDPLAPAGPPNTGVPELESAPEQVQGSATSATATENTTGVENDITPAPVFAKAAGTPGIPLRGYDAARVGGLGNAMAPAEAIDRFGQAEVEYQKQAGLESDALSKALEERKVKIDDAAALMAKHQQDNDAQMRKRLEAIDEATARTTADLKDTGKFWRNPVNVLSSIVMSFLPMAGVGNDAGIKAVNKAVMDDWNQRRDQANMELGALRSNLQAFRDITGDQKAGDMLALSEAWKQVGLDSARIAAQFGSAKSKAQGEMLQALAQEKSAEARNNMLMRLYLLGVQPKPIADLYKQGGFYQVGQEGKVGQELQPTAPKVEAPNPANELAGQVAEGVAGDLTGLPPVVAAARQQMAKRAAAKAPGVAAPSVGGAAAKAGLSTDAGDFWLPNGLPNPNRKLDPSTEAGFRSPQEADAYRKALRSLDNDIVNRVLAAHKGQFASKEEFQQKVAGEYSKFIQTEAEPQAAKAKEAAAPFIQGLTTNQLARQAMADLKQEFTKNGKFNAEGYRDAIKDFSNVNLISETLSNNLNRWAEEIGATEAQKSATQQRIMKARVAINQAIAMSRKDVFGAVTASDLAQARNLVSSDSSPARIEAFLDMSAKVYQAQADNAAPTKPFAKALYLSTIPRWHAATNVSGKRVK